MSKPLVGVVMGSNSDWDVMSHAVELLKSFDITHEFKVVSAHRTPDLLFEYADSAQKRGLKAIIAGAGGAAHLPGMIASISPLPIIGVPIKSSNSIDGWDSILSILQMPGGVPVATVALNGAKNAGILAAQIVATGCEKTREEIIAYKQILAKQVEEKSKKLVAATQKR